MLIRFHQALAKKDKGFTLIELLVVIIIIGILAAIAIPAFLKQREKAWGSAVTSDLKNASIAVESYATENNGSFADFDNETDLTAGGYNPSDGVTDLSVTPTDSGTAYTITAGHENLDGTWTYSSTTGTIEKD